MSERANVAAVAMARSRRVRATRASESELGRARRTTDRRGRVVEHRTTQ